MKFSNLFKGMALAFACAGMFALTASAQESRQTSNDQMGMKSGSMANGMSTADEHFVKKAAQGGMAEVELGELAQQKAASPEVKRFAQRMVTDHTKANDELKQVASEKNITLPQSLDAKDEATKKKLSALSGEQFDRAYMNDMVNDHTKDVSEFKQESTSAKDPAIKNFAASTLPTLEDHLKEARQIAPKVTK
jgi:putative membrane protein